MKTCEVCGRRPEDGSHWACFERTWAALVRLADTLKEMRLLKRLTRRVEDESSAQARLDRLTAYAVRLRREHKGNDAVGEICDQVELLAWGPLIVRGEHGEFKGFEL